MLRRFQLITLLLAWLATTGAQWDLVQTFGWARMMVNYSRTMPLLEAAKRTFSGEMCGVCELVNDAGQKEQAQSTTPGSRLDTKLIFLAQPAVAYVAPVVPPQAWVVRDLTLAGADRAAPPTPPPRA
ncbi:MAG: hypothetical protein JSS11_17000 [Verrucomicrobia bacterium]|nr:hypothetical protein [Verrucomicrobiota bacterium]